MKKTWKTWMIFLLIAVFALSFVACKDKENEDQTNDQGTEQGNTDVPANPGNSGNSNNNNNGNNNSGTNENEPVVNMTNSYKTGRESFYAITGYWLPQYENVELLASSDFNTAYLTACFDINGTQEMLNQIKETLQKQIGAAPVAHETGKSFHWSLEFTKEGKTYTAMLDAMLADETETTQIYVNYTASALSDSYVYARNYFTDALGITLPSLSGLEVSIGFGGDSIMFDIVDGDYCSKFAYEDFEGFFDETLADWTKNGTEKNERNYKEGYTEINYTKEPGGWVGLTWDSYNSAVYINAKISNSAFNPYAKIKANFNERFGIALPDYQNVKVTFYSCNEEGKEITLNIASESLTYNDYTQLENLFTATLGECSEAPTGDATSGRDAQWKKDGFWYSTTWAPAGTDHNENPTPPSIDINVSPIQEQE